ncbi:hypothetical protein Tco_0509854, partial [Tanacetum coccineum]
MALGPWVQLLELDRSVILLVVRKPTDILIHLLSFSRNNLVHTSVSSWKR